MIDTLKAIAADAGREILSYYGKVSSSTKADNSPLTQADLASHRLICERLQFLTPEIPVLSEESETLDPSIRARWNEFWLVDPLDGTKEFLKQSGEFTVNIARVRGGQPILGVVHSPVLGLTYWAERGEGAFKQQGVENEQPIRTRIPQLEKLVIVASRDHAGPLVKELLSRFPDATTSSMGSSLKFCLVAEGSADIYLRDVPTSEWDTAAAQCVVEEAGGVVMDLANQPLKYNKSDLRNPSIITLGDRSFAWR